MESLLAHREWIVAGLAVLAVYLGWPALSPLVARLRRANVIETPQALSPDPRAGAHAVLDALTEIDQFLAAHEVPRDRRQQLVAEITPHLCCQGHDHKG